jgi:hypothetical protein
LFFEITKRNFILKSNGREAWIVHYIEGAIPPIRLGVLLGECVFNIRSALDNLVCGLIRTADSHALCKGTQFPICSAQEQWERNWQKYLKGVEPAAQRMIRDLQPCFRMSAAPENDPLSILNVLSNSDKHRAVTLTLAYSHTSRSECKRMTGRSMSGERRSRFMPGMSTRYHSILTPRASSLAPALMPEAQTS